MNSTESVEVLLVEDREEDAELTIAELKKHGLANSIKWVEDGEEALDYLASHAVVPKIVLLDLKLPKVSGIEVLREMRRDGRTRHVPVIVMTSSKEGRDLTAAYENGANSYVVKPVEFGKFSKVIQQLGMYWLVVNQPPREVSK